MLKIEHIDVHGWEAAIRGMRNPMNSWDKSDSLFSMGDSFIGENDLSLMHRLVNAGSDHGKFIRMITVSLDVIAPLYWWKEYDTYKVGTVANSCSTMHKIHAKEFELEDFSTEHLLHDEALAFMEHLVDGLNYYRRKYLESKDKIFWWQLIQLLPTSYNQRRTIHLNYAVLQNIYRARHNHKLDEWHTFCEFIETLPYSELITGGDKLCTTST